MTVKDGDCCFFHGGLENVIDGTLNVKSDQDSGRLVATRNEQYWTGSGSIFADSARAARKADAINHYINFGGTLKLYMNGNWYTATYVADQQNPNYPTRFRMTDGTTLGATKDWTYGPRTDAGKEAYTEEHPATITPADRTSIMTGTVTVNTQSPKDDAAHTITFVDPLNASGATLVKAGLGTLAFDNPAEYPSQIGTLEVSKGTARFQSDATLGDLTIASGATASFATAPTLSGTLTFESTGANFRVDSLGDSKEWAVVATADDIVGPKGATLWDTDVGKLRFKIVDVEGGKQLLGSHASGFSVILR